MTSTPSLAASVAGLVRSRDLLWTWTLRTLRARYQQSILGWLWAVVQPVAQVLIFALIFTKVVPVDTGGVPYVLFAYVALTPWAFLSTALTDMSTAIVDNMLLVTKIYFPREVLPLAAMLARFMDFVVASALVVLLVIYFRVPVRPSALLLLPVVVAVQAALIVGLGLAAAAANTFLRDVKPLLALVVQLWFYLSPIIYPLDKVPAAWRTLYSLNPAVGVIETYRAIWFGTPLPVASLAIAAVVAAASLVAGYALFKRSELVFSDIA
ncbi:MAG: ABC transporter permease [Vicinamibacterales bacterium]